MKSDIYPPPVGAQESVDLMIYHLRMAAAYYEATPANTGQVRLDIIQKTAPNTREQKAALLWYKVMDQVYGEES